ncbi:MAG: hypothetical protein HYY11_03535 [Candidatus Methylomirabilis oxyfera]|nr:hypothetical protein [Candidatus Methylomirabilis oxyfera]
MNMYRKRSEAVTSSALLFLTLICLVGLVGCATTPHPVLSEEPGGLLKQEELTDELGTVGVVVTAREPGLEMPWMGAGAAALKYGATGLFGPAFLGALTGPGIILAPVGAVLGPIGAITGAVCAPPKRDINRAENLLQQRLASVQLNDALRDAVVQAARDRTSRSVVPLGDAARFASQDGTTYRSLSTEGVHTVLEISVPWVALEIKSLEGGSLLRECWTEMLGMWVMAEARLVRVADDVELYRLPSDAAQYREEGLARSLRDWAEDDAQPFHDELKAVPEVLARAIVGKLF